MTPSDSTYHVGISWEYPLFGDYPATVKLGAELQNTISIGIELSVRQFVKKNICFPSFFFR